MSRPTIWPAIALAVSGMVLCGCNGTSDIFSRSDGKAHINDRTKFSSSAYGVAASPRVTTSRKVRKGGGRAQVGKPYKVRGRWYVPKEEPGYDKSGQASWYGPNFHGRLTANGEVYDQYALSGAHPTFPLPSYARVTNLKNGQSVVVRVNDRGPYHAGRVIDLSAKAAKLLDYQHKGIARVRVQYIGRAPLHGKDARYLASTYQRYDASSVVAAIAPARKSRKSTKTVSDAIKTGSVAGKGTSGDPFLRELRAIGQNVDTGSTLAKRLKR